MSPQVFVMLNNIHRAKKNRSASNVTVSIPSHTEINTDYFLLCAGLQFSMESLQSELKVA